MIKNISNLGDSALYCDFGNDVNREINSKVEYLTSYKNIGIGISLGYKSDPYHIKFMEDYWYASLGFNITI